MVKSKSIMISIQLSKTAQPIHALPMHRRRLQMQMDLGKSVMLPKIPRKMVLTTSPMQVEKEVKQLKMQKHMMGK